MYAFLHIHITRPVLSVHVVLTVVLACGPDVTALVTEQSTALGARSTRLGLTFPS